LALLLGSGDGGAKAAGLRIGKRALRELLRSLPAALLGPSSVSVRHTLQRPATFRARCSKHPEGLHAVPRTYWGSHLASFAYLRRTFDCRGNSVCYWSTGALRFCTGVAPLWPIALMMVLFFHASRLAARKNSIRILIRGRSPKRSSIPRPVNSFSTASIIPFFFRPFSTPARTALLLNGRETIWNYGSYAPGSPPVFHRGTRSSRICGPSRRAATWFDPTPMM